MSDWRVPLTDIVVTDDDIAAVSDCLRSGWLTLGPRTAAFESALAEHVGTPHAIAVSSGTAALHLACCAAGLGPGDEVIVPAFTFIASASAVRYVGATPVLCDVTGPQDFNIDLDDVRRRITPRTRAVIAVHFCGYPADVLALRELCDEHGLILIEDCAQAICALADGEGRQVGTVGDLGAFSFFSKKQLCVGEGGMVTTASDELAERVKLLRSHAMTSGTWDRHSGRTDTYDVDGLGFNYRLDEPRAALLLSRLGRLESEIERRRELTLRYRELLKGVDGIILPFDDSEVPESSCYVISIMIEEDGRQAEVSARLRERGIQTSIFYPSIHLFSAYRERFPGVSLPITELASRSELTLPFYPHMSFDDQDRVASALAEAVAR
jgi:dTDP-4-amino-4,6-dideoxygalactose transaminase